MNALLLASVATTSLLGSLHCAAMCGPFVAVYSGQSGHAPLRAHLAYNGGRLFTYLTLGAISGALGHALDLAGSALGVARTASIVCGGLIVVFALQGMLSGRRSSHGGFFDRLLVRLAPRLLQASPSRRALILGLCTTLLPCGWLYAFVAAAAATGSASQGSLLMLAFWSGTVPLMAGLGLGLSRLATRLRGHVMLAASCLLFVMGIATVAGRLRLPAFAELPGSAHSPEGHGSSGAITPPCHHR